MSTAGPRGLNLEQVLIEEAVCLHDFAKRPATQAELNEALHRLPDEEQRAALCLSGGGIRSAVFCLGALQGLARLGLLQRFHFLSTVSGGGYTGSWLSSWIHRRKDLDAVVAELAGANRTGSPEPEPLRRLRGYSSYLTPVWGFSTDFLTLVATAARNLLLNWLVFLPLLLAGVLAPQLMLAFVAAEAPGPSSSLLLAASALLVAVAIAYIGADLPGPVRQPGRAHDQFGALCFAPLVLASLGLSLAVRWHPSAVTGFPLWKAAAAGAALHGLAAILGLYWRERRGLAPRVTRKWWPPVVALVGSGAAAGALLHTAAPYAASSKATLEAELYATLSVPLLLMVFWLGLAAQAALSRRYTDESDREWWSRASARWLGAAIAWAGVFALVLLVPAWLLGQGWSDKAKGLAGVGSVLLGVLVSAIGYLSKNGDKVRQQAESLATLLGMRLLDLAAGAFVLALAVGLGLVSRAMLVPGLQAWMPLSAGLVFAIVFLLAVGLLMSWVVGTNTFSLHAMYGNRLVRAFLGASRQDRQPHWFTGFDPKDNLPLANLAPRSRGRLFHVVNAALNLVEPAGGRLEWQQRKAESFTFTPLHSGSASTGYVDTGSYAGTEGVSLGRALTISGAAASPNMGYHTSALVAFVMTLFNVRLGWWLPNPSPRWRAHWHRSEPASAMTPLRDEALGKATGSKSSVYLSDGGHFDNLGLYEMVRRRCRLIVLVDATCDPRYEYGDLERTIRHIRVDLGIRIEFPGGLPGAREPKVPGRLGLGTIHYAEVDGKDAPAGRLVYLKPVVLGDEPVDVLRYAADNARPGAAFPHQPTSDQFFDEAQFESYRALGLHSAEKAFEAMGRTTWPHLGLVPVHARVAFAPVAASAAAPLGFPMAAREEARAAPALWSEGVREAGSVGQKMFLTSLAGAAVVSGAATLLVTHQFSDADRELMKKGVELRLAEGDRALLVRGMPVAPADLRALAEAAADLQAAADKLARENGNADLAPAVRALATAVEDARRTLPRQDDVREVQRTLASIRARIDQLPAPTPVDTAPLVKTLEGIRTSLQSIEAAARETVPRRNMRAVGEAR